MPCSLINQNNGITDNSKDGIQYKTYKIQNLEMTRKHERSYIDIEAILILIDIRKEYNNIIVTLQSMPGQESFTVVTKH